MSIVNIFNIFRDQTPTNNLNLKDFRLAVAAELIGADPGLLKKGRKSLENGPNNYKRSVPPGIKYNKCAHMPMHGTNLRYAHCSSRSEPHQTRWHCSSSSVAFCLTKKSNCFLNSTKQLDFSKKCLIFYNTI